MGRPYSLDLRERVVAAMSAGMSGRDAAKHFSVGGSTALRWARRSREAGSPKAKPMGGKRPFAFAAHRNWIVARLTEKPDLTLRALLAELKTRGATGSYFAIWNIVADANLSFKRKPARQRAGPARCRTETAPARLRLAAHRHTGQSVSPPSAPELSA
jgi:transposase